MYWSAKRSKINCVDFNVCTAWKLKNCCRVERGRGRWERVVLGTFRCGRCMVGGLLVLEVKGKCRVQFVSLLRSLWRNGHELSRANPSPRCPSSTSTTNARSTFGLYWLFCAYIDCFAHCTPCFAVWMHCNEDPRQNNQYTHAHTSYAYIHIIAQLVKIGVRNDLVVNKQTTSLAHLVGGRRQEESP